VKIEIGDCGEIGSRGEIGTRATVARLILEHGPQTAAVLAGQLGLSAAGVRRHLDALVADDVLVECEPRRPVQRGRGRPARTYALTDAGRASFPHAYDNLATTALRYLRETGGEDAVTAFAEHRAATLEHMLLPSVPAGNADERAAALARALSTQGYAASTEYASAPGVAGVQICQHHCPVANVAAEFPQLCEAETRAFERVLGTYVQRLATIAHGDGVCTTHVPVPPPSSLRIHSRSGSSSSSGNPSKSRSSAKFAARSGRTA
jgi:predicted ArsR family transcriptional regulator